MTRKNGWEQALAEVVEKHALMGFEYGVSDCFMFARDSIRVCRGEDLFDGLEPYKTMRQSLKVLKSNKCQDVGELLGSKLEEVPVAFAQRGDVGVVDDGNEISAGVFFHGALLAKSETGIQTVPINQVMKAFRV